MGERVGRVIALTGVTTSRSDLVAEAIRSAILSGDLKPDELLVERQLAQILGVSKTPVREALILLASTGLVTTSRNRGVTVRRLTSVDEVRHIYEERVLLEPWALGSAIRRGQPLDFTEAAQLVEEAQELADKNEPALLAMTNRRFHRVMYSQCENPLVVRALDNLQDLTALAIVSVLWEHWPTWRKEADEHDQIAQAAAAGDADEAERLMRGHIERSIARLGEVAGSGNNDVGQAATSPEAPSLARPATSRKSFSPTTKAKS